MNSDKYGGGGIFNLYITAAAHSRASEYVMVHEMGHHIAGLADEYYTATWLTSLPTPRLNPGSLI
jgi:hypothetical protein